MSEFQRKKEKFLTRLAKIKFSCFENFFRQRLFDANKGRCRCTPKPGVAYLSKQHLLYLGRYLE